MTRKIQNNKAFVILFAVTISSILLAIGLGVTNIAFREIKFGTSARDANDAFFAADTGAEYALFLDKDDDICTPAPCSLSPDIVKSQLGSLGQSCVIVSVTKTTSVPATTIIAKGYNSGGGTASSCNPGVNAVERQLEARY